MARAANGMPGTGIVRRLRATWFNKRLSAFSLDDPRSTTALAHYAALAASLLIVALHPPLNLADQFPFILNDVYADALKADPVAS